MPSLKKNIAYQTAYQLLIVIIPLILAPYISRVIGAEKLGIYSYTYSIASYFVMFAMLGISHHGSRTIAAVREDNSKLNETFSNLLALHIAAAVIVCIGYGVFIIFSSLDYRLLYIIQALLVIAAVLDINWFFFGLEEFKLSVVRNAIIKVLTVVFIFAFVKTSDDLWLFTLIMSAGIFLSQSVIWFFVKRFAKLVKPSWSGIKPHIKPTLIMFVPVIAISVYNVMDKIMLGAMSDKVQLGFYENAGRVVTVPLSFIIAFNAVMIPRMANLSSSGDKDKSLGLISLSMKYVMLLAFAMAFGIAAIAKQFAPIYFGEEFRACGGLIIGLCGSVPFLAFSNLLAAQYLVPNSKDKIYVGATVSGAAINVIANLILIPKYAAFGAVIGTIFAEFTRCAIMAFAIRKALPIGKYIFGSLPPLMFGFVMFFTVSQVGKFLGETIPSVLAQIGVGMAVYICICSVYLFISKDEFFINGVKKVLRSSK